MKYFFVIIGFVSLAVPLALAQGRFVLKAPDLLFAPDSYTEVTAKDLGLRGPVQQIVLERYIFDPSGDPSVRQDGFGDGRNPNRPKESLHIFDSDGHLKISMGALGEYVFYQYDNGAYKGFESCFVDPTKVTSCDSDNSPGAYKKVTVEQVSGSEKIVNRELQDNNRRIRYLYDEQGQLMSEDYFDFRSGSWKRAKTYFYESDKLTRTEALDGYEGMDITTNEYNDQGLLTKTEEVGVDLGKDRSICFGEGGKVEVTTPGCRSYSSEVDSYYLDNSLAQTIITNYRRDQDIVSKEISSIMSISTIRYNENGNTIEFIQFEQSILSSHTTYIYDNENKLLQYTHRYADSSGKNLLVEQCDYTGFDQYDNWTERRCTDPVYEDQFDSVLNPFKGNLLQRSFTYYAAR